jgi:hypothetical protein
MDSVTEIATYRISGKRMETDYFFKTEVMNPYPFLSRWK